jgi:SH3-like domain-containing protein
MRKIIIITGLVISISLCLAEGYCRAEDIAVTAAGEFTGRTNEDNINVRADANTNSPVICKLPKGEGVEIILERYDWYKIRLPRQAAAFVKKSLLEPIDEKTAKAKAENINIRMQPNQTSAILGRLQQNEVVAIIRDKGEWLKIEPTANTFGWIHKKFVGRKEPAAAGKKQEKVQLKEAGQQEEAQAEEIVTEGLIQPYGKVINRIATHKLITKDYSVYLLRGNTDNLKPLVYHKVRVSGKIISLSKEKYPVIEISKLEALD